MRRSRPFLWVSNLLKPQTSEPVPTPCPILSKLLPSLPLFLLTLPNDSYGGPNDLRSSDPTGPFKILFCLADLAAIR